MFYRLLIMKYCGKRLGPDVETDFNLDLCIPYLLIVIGKTYQFSWDALNVAYKKGLDDFFII